MQGDRAPAARHCSSAVKAVRVRGSAPLLIMATFELSQFLSPFDSFGVWLCHFSALVRPPASNDVVSL